MRILAIDFGLKRIGLAVSDEAETIARGIPTITRKGNKIDIKRIEQIVKEFEIQKIIIGIPYNSDGSVSKTGVEIQKFSRLIENELHLPIKLVDETYTTASAENILLEADISRRKRKKVIDKLSAIIILQEFLNNN